MSGCLQPLGGWFSADEWPDLTCPLCNSGTLRVDESQKVETAMSVGLRSHEAWEPEWISGFFMCRFRCQSNRCQEVVLALGEWRVRENGWTEAGPDYRDDFRLRSTLPPVPIARLPEGCPEPVKEAVSLAAQAIWGDPGGAGGHLRRAIERVLDDQGIARSRATTHQRIDEFRRKNASVAEVLEAVKWIGNQATHEDSLSVADVLEGAELLEHALTLLYDTSPKAIMRRAQEINRARGFPKR